VGISTGKDAAGIIQVLARMADRVVVTAADHPRVTDPDELHQQFKDWHTRTMVAPTVAQALDAAWEMADPDDVICATGSLFIVGDMLTAWEARME
jgi:dihydrofolate synthase/folylpolyglutamate synthase